MTGRGGGMSRFKSRIARNRARSHRRFFFREASVPARAAQSLQRERQAALPSSECPDTQATAAGPPIEFD
jgi:hypothetical protein